MSSIILLSGPVGAGKSTIAPELVANAPGPCVLIEGDKFWFFIAKGGEKMGRHKNFLTITASMIASSFSFARAGYEVIIDFSIPPSYLSKARELITSRNFTLDYIIVKPDIKVCEKRAAEREEGKIAKYSQYKEFYDLFAGMEENTIHNDQADAATVAAWIREGINDGTFQIK